MLQIHFCKKQQPLDTYTNDKDGRKTSYNWCTVFCLHVAESASACFKCHVHVTEFIVPKIDTATRNARGFGNKVEEMWLQTRLQGCRLFLRGQSAGCKVHLISFHLLWDNWLVWGSVVVFFCSLPEQLIPTVSPSLLKQVIYDGLWLSQASFLSAQLKAILHI